MTLQQLEYIVALEKYGHFQLAAEACGITQPTLSATIAKLEDELDTRIFDRSKHPIVPTDSGRKILVQARVVLFNSAQLKEMALSEREQGSGELVLGVIPTIAPYVLPKLIKDIHENSPRVSLRVTEARTGALVSALEKAEVDMALLVTPLDNAALLEVPVYYEKFVAYVSPSHPLYQNGSLQARSMRGDKLWVLRDEHCMSNQVLNLCHLSGEYATIYRAGSIDTLIKIVDENGGYTVIPELHVDLLNEQQRKNIRPIVNPDPVREVSLVIRRDYVREKLLNIVADGVRGIIPEHMVDSRLKKFAIKI